ncbi:MAG TPA: pyridoxal-phosphate dependent enzyme [Treponema sp.]|nr:pyridoxal-phosphate dependent enzyme [Treponema sp.]
MNWFLQCTECGKQFPLEPGRYLCDVCSAQQKPDRPLRGILECRWEAPSAHEKFGDSELSSGHGRSGSKLEAGQRRSVDGPGTPDSPSYSRGGPGSHSSGDQHRHVPSWEQWLPVDSRFFPPIPVGHTPLWEPMRLRELTDIPNLFIKDDTCEPSGSFKDRASFLVAAFALERGIKEIALASTGNAASSMAAVGAASHINIRVFLPKKAPIAKRIQVLQYGAALTEIDGTYDVAFEASLAYSRETGVLSRNTAYNPLTIEGKKTVSFEIASQLAELGKRADHIFVPVGDGVILAGLYKGFEDLLRLGTLERMPVIWACQAEGSSAIARAWSLLQEKGVIQPDSAPHASYSKSGDGRHLGDKRYAYTTAREVFTPESFSSPQPSSTIADSISVDVPRNGYHALGKLSAYGGMPVAVNDREILLAQRELASHSGLFAEPSSSAAWAGFRKVLNEQAAMSRDTGNSQMPRIRRDDTVVILITGSGLKDTASALKALELS